MNILVTGARAPICADIVRVLAEAGHAVWTADFLRWPIGAFSPYTRGYVRLPAPRKDFSSFQAQLVGACERLHIDRIIPTSEEVFWLSAVQGLPSFTEGLYPALATLKLLHNKLEFAGLAQSLGYGPSENYVFQSRNELDSFAAQRSLQDFVLKPVYSRFASAALISPKLDQLHAVYPSPSTPWLAQTRAYGREVCVYNIAKDGELLLHTAYLPRWRAGKGAGVYFEPVYSDAVKALSEKFIRATRFTGQISFDVIETATGLVAIECNPRGTSGVHLAAQHSRVLSDALLGQVTSSVQELRPAMLGLPLLMYNPFLLLTSEGRAAWGAAQDALCASQVTLRAQALATAELLLRAAVSGHSAIAATTADIEWNGEIIGGTK